MLNPALGKSHLSFATGLPPRAALCALGLFFPALHFATLLFPLEGKRCPTCVVFGYLGSFCWRHSSVGRLPRPSDAGANDLIAAHLELD